MMSELPYLLTLIIILPISDNRFLFTNNPRGAQRCYNNEVIFTAIHSSWRQCSRNVQRSKPQKHQYGSGTNEPYKRPLDLACKSIEIVKNLFFPPPFFTFIVMRCKTMFSTPDSSASFLSSPKAKTKLKEANFQICKYCRYQCYISYMTKLSPKIKYCRKKIRCFQILNKYIAAIPLQRVQ